MFLLSEFSVVGIGPPTSIFLWHFPMAFSNLQDHPGWHHDHGCFKSSMFSQSACELGISSKVGSICRALELTWFFKLVWALYIWYIYIYIGSLKMAPHATLFINHKSWQMPQMYLFDALGSCRWSLSWFKFAEPILPGYPKIIYVCMYVCMFVCLYVCM